MKKKKLIFLETLLKNGGGHHMDNLIETSIYFKDKSEIHWLVNENFDKNKLYIPNEITIHKSVPETKFIFLKKIKIFLLSIPFFIKEKKILNFFKIFYKNFFSIPDYFSLKIYSFFKSQKFTNTDVIIIQSCRPKDVELIYFISELLKNMPKIIMRVLYPPKKKILKNFYYHTEQLIKNKNKVKIFTEVSTTKHYIKERLNYEVQNFTQIYGFYNRPIPKKITLGFLGETRNDKGFSRLPNFISILNNKNVNYDFIIQFSKKIYPNTEEIKKEILELSKQNNNIRIIDGYIDFWDYREYLKKINIMPLMYDADKLNFVGSGLFYSCITNEIPMIIPSKANLLDEYLIFNSFEKATTDEEYVSSVLKIIDNYEFYLKECKKFSNSYQKDIANDPLVLELNKS